MSVINALNTTLYSTLTGGTALTNLLAGTASVYYQQAPEGSSLPYVVWNYQYGAMDNQTTSDMYNELIFIRGYAASPALAGSIDTQIHALIHGKTLSVSGYKNFWTVREEEISLVENPPDRQPIWMAGAMYRVRLT